MASCELLQASAGAENTQALIEEILKLRNHDPLATVLGPLTRCIAPTQI